MRIVIAGVGRVGSELALRLAEEGHDVSVIDEDEIALRDLGSSFNGVTFRGSAFDISTLHDAGIEYADAFVAVTSSDNANLMSVQLAKEVFEVPRTIARLDDPQREDSYRALDVQYVAASSLVSKVILEQLVEEDFQYHVSFPTGDVEVVEMRVGGAASGVSCGDFEVDETVRIADVRRGSETVIPTDGFRLEEGDLVVAATRLGSRHKISKYLTSSEAR